MQITHFIQRNRFENLHIQNIIYNLRNRWIVKNFPLKSDQYFPILFIRLYIFRLEETTKYQIYLGNYSDVRTSVWLEKDSLIFQTILEYLQCFRLYTQRI